MKKAKKFLKIIYVQLILFTILFNLCGCSRNDSNSEKNPTKIESELSYLDSRITTMINMVENLKLKNYDVSEEPNKEENKNTTSSSSQDSNNMSNEDNPKKYRLISTNILTQDYSIDWASLKNNVENLESVWPTIVLDLYKNDINGQDILAISNGLDRLVKCVKEENKEETVKELADIYKYVTKLMEGGSSDEIMKNIYSTKSNVFAAYSILDKEQWDEISKYLSEAQKSYENVLNKVLEEERTEMEYNVNKAYIELKELQNCVGNKDKEIFLIKYRNLIDELDTI